MYLKSNQTFNIVYQINILKFKHFTIILYYYAHFSVIFCTRFLFFKKLYNSEVKNFLSLHPCDHVTFNLKVNLFFNIHSHIGNRYYIEQNDAIHLVVIITN